MAILIDEDGNETVGGVAQLRSVFEEVGDGRLVIQTLTLSYDHSVAPNGQVVEITGTKDGTPFSVKTDLILPPMTPAPAVRRLARGLLATA